MALEAAGTDMELSLLTSIPTDMEPPEAATGFMPKVDGEPEFLLMATGPARLLVPVGPRMLPVGRCPLELTPKDRDSEMEGLDCAPAWFSGPMETIAVHRCWPTAGLGCAFLDLRGSRVHPMR